MIKPENVQDEAAKKEYENKKFRTFLKCNADENELDQQFQKLHQELFAGYDCNSCRNCCKQYYGSIPETDVEQDAKHLNMDVRTFIHEYLEPDENSTEYHTKNMPCDFLQEDGSCMLGDCKPLNCKNYPYTDQPDRLWSLYSVLEAVEVCPVAYEIFESLKQEYGFRCRR